MATDFIKFIEYLLPGFLASWVFYGFTAFVKPNQFERVIQALIFTIIVEALLTLFRQILGSSSVRTDQDLLLSVPIAFFTGIVFATFANHSVLHGVANALGISSETSYPSEWYGVFAKKRTYIVLHMKDERRIYGWPLEWPSQPEVGHFQLTDAVWLTDNDEEEQIEIDLSGVDSILISANDVHFVEFMKMETHRE